MLFTVPDYYPEFSCKMGACRHACCEGWPVSLSMSDYFRLLGEDLSPELRRRMDTALHIKKYATPDDYAFIAPRWDGSCPLRHPDGRCALQVEKGEEALTAICRLYPRGIRTEGRNEISCAASCERVVELMLFRTKPIEFIEKELDILLPSHLEKSVFDNTKDGEIEKRFEIIRALQDRRYHMAARLMQISGLLKNGVLSEAPAHSPATYSSITMGLSVAEKILEYAEEHSSAVHGCGLTALEYFGSGYGCVQKYLDAAKNLERLLGDPETVFEHLMVNHLFFERWPFHSGLETPDEQFTALCGVYGLIRFLALGYTAVHKDIQAFTDCVSAAFRLIEHTEYEKYVCSLLTESGYTSSEALYDFISL